MRHWCGLGSKFLCVRLVIFQEIGCKQEKGDSLFFDGGGLLEARAFCAFSYQDTTATALVRMESPYVCRRSHCIVACLPLLDQLSINAARPRLPGFLIELSQILSWRPSSRE